MNNNDTHPHQLEQAFMTYYYIPAHFKSRNQAMRLIQIILLAFFTVHVSAFNVFSQANEVQIRPDMDPAALQNQLRSLQPGSTIRLLPGRHTKQLHFSNLHGTPSTPILITASPDAILEGPYNGSSDTFTKSSGILLDSSSDIVLEQLTISGFERGITIGGCRSVTVKSNKIHDIGNYGVMNYHSDGTKITGNKIERSYREHGIYVSESGKDIEVLDNIIQDTHINGIHINGNIPKPIVTGNTLLRTGSFPTKEGGAGLTLVGGTTEPVVERNTFKDIYGQGITTEAPNSTIKDNTFESYSWSGILGLPKAQGLKLVNNTFRDSKVIPLQLYPVVLSSLSATGNRYSTSGPVCQEYDSNRTYGLKQWREIGKDAQ